MMMLSQAANAINGKLIGTDVLFTAVSKDTRTIEKGDLYVAIKGDHFDGHEFVKQAGSAGAVGALVSNQQQAALPQICVTDTRIALGDLAASWRQKFTGKLIGITGSNGKTTVKEMCSSILSSAVGEEKVLYTQGNLNNDIGMPMTLLSIRDQHEYAVIEMGANHVGEIDYLTGIAKPDVALVNNAGPAHLEGFGSIDLVAQAKAEIYGGLSPAGMAVINLDDNYADYWFGICKGKNITTFSMQNAEADVYAESRQDCFVLHTPVGQAEIRLNLPGKHNVMNALAATAATVSAGIALEAVVNGLSSFSGVSGRLYVSRASNGACVIDDTYNANPLSVAAAIDALMNMDGERWLVLGDMAELGAKAESLHFDVGCLAKEKGINKLLATGILSQYSVNGFGKGAVFFEDREKLVEEIKNTMRSDTLILVKGSRSMKMEDVVSELLVSADKNNNKNKNKKGTV